MPSRAFNRYHLNGTYMDAELLKDKTALLAAIERADASLKENSSIYALVETEDPGWPFEIRLLSAAPLADAELKVINERLFDRAFLDFGYHEVRDENNIAGISYEPVEELFSNPDCIGVTGLELFDDELAAARMAHGMDEDDDASNPDNGRFAAFLRAVRGSVVEGSPAAEVSYDDVQHLCGLIFKYQCGPERGDCVVAFQRVQPMWIQQKSSILTFDPDATGATAFSGRSLKIGTSFDFSLYGGKVFFRSLKALEILFKYKKLVAQQAKDYADSLEPILADFEKIDERIEKSRAVANKLLKLQQDGSPVAEIDPAELEGRISRIAYYSRKVKFNEEGKVMLTTDTQVNDFIRMLSDTFLVSPLSAARYEARTKKLLDSDEV